MCSYLADLMSSLMHSESRILFREYRSAVCWLPAIYAFVCFLEFSSWEEKHKMDVLRCCSQLYCEEVIQAVPFYLRKQYCI